MSVFASVLATMVPNMQSNLCIKMCLYYSTWLKYQSSFLELEMGADNAFPHMALAFQWNPL